MTFTKCPTAFAGVTMQAADLSAENIEAIRQHAIKRDAKSNARAERQRQWMATIHQYSPRARKGAKQ